MMVYTVAWSLEPTYPIKLWDVYPHSNVTTRQEQTTGWKAFTTPYKALLQICILVYEKLI